MKQWTSAKKELPRTDEEVIVLDKDGRISFAHIVYPDKAIGYNGWNVPDVVFWRPCGFTEEMAAFFGTDK